MPEKNGHVADPNELDIDGSRVWLKARLPLRDGSRIPALLQACTDGDLMTQVKVFQLVIERWEWPGDPATVQAYEDLDVYTQVVPLALQVAERLQQRLSANPKGVLAGVSGSALPSTSR